MDPIQCHVSQHARCTTMLSEPTSGGVECAARRSPCLTVDSRLGRTNGSQWDWAAGLQTTIASSRGLRPSAAHGATPLQQHEHYCLLLEVCERGQQLSPHMRLIHRCAKERPRRDMTDAAGRFGTRRSDRERTAGRARRAVVVDIIHRQCRAIPCRHAHLCRCAVAVRRCRVSCSCGLARRRFR